MRASPPLERVVGRNRTKADVVLFAHDGQRIALKDYSPRPWIVRETLGRILVRRECAAYLAAGATEGLALFLGRAGPFALATRWIDAPPLAARSPGTVPAGCFERLASVVARLHSRGIALGDLHHRDVLVDDAGSVWVVDLATAWILGDRPSGWRRRVFARLAEADRASVARLRARHRGEDESLAIERAVGADALARYRRARRLKRFADRWRGRRRA